MPSIGTSSTSACRRRGACCCIDGSANKGEQLYRERTGDIAAELAMHFERAADYRRPPATFSRPRTTPCSGPRIARPSRCRAAGWSCSATLPDTPERARQELRLHTHAGRAADRHRGLRGARRRRRLPQSTTLCERLGDTPEISQVLWGLWTFHTLKAELSTALEIAKEFLRLAERLPYPGLAMRGHWAMEITATHQGEFALAVEHFDKALELYEPEQHRDDAFLDTR